MGGKFLVCFGTYQGKSNIVVMTGQRIFGFNLPPPLAAFLNQKEAANCIETIDLGPDGHYGLTYRQPDGSSYQLRSPGLEAWLGVPPLPNTSRIAFSFGYPTGIIAQWIDPRTQTEQWVARDLPQSMLTWMGQHGYRFEHVQSFDLGHNGSWILITHSLTGYDVSDDIAAKIRSGANLSSVTLGKMNSDWYYLDAPLPYFSTDTEWIETIKTVVNDSSIQLLAKGYYDANSRSVVLGGMYFPSARYVAPSFASPNFASPGFTASPDTSSSYFTADNFSNGIDIVNNTMSVMNNVTSAGVTTASSCCSLM